MSRAKHIATAAFLAAVLSGCTGGELRPLRSPIKAHPRRPAPALAPQEPVALPGAEQLPIAEPTSLRPDAKLLETKVFQKAVEWMLHDAVTMDLRLVEGQLARELPGELVQEARTLIFPQLKAKVLAKAVHDAVDLAVQLSTRTSAVSALVKLDMAQEALAYYSQRYGITGEFRPVIAAIGPLNEIEKIRSGAHIGSGQIQGLFYKPSNGRPLEVNVDETFSTDGAPGLKKLTPKVRLRGLVLVHGLGARMHREIFTATFGSPYVVFLDRAAAERPTLLSSSVLVHELKHYLDYLRDPSATPTFAEPMELSTLRKEMSRPGAEDAAWEIEKQSSRFERFMADALELAIEKTGGEDETGLRAKIEERYHAYFRSEWTEHLPYLLHPSEASAFLEQVRFYKHRHFHGEDRVLRNLMEMPPTEGAIRFPMPGPVERYFRILFRAG